MKFDNFYQVNNNEYLLKLNTCTQLWLTDLQQSTPVD